MNRIVCGTTLVLLLFLVCGNSYALSIPTYDSYYVEISNLTEYRYCPAIGDWEMHGFFPMYNGSTTQYITPTAADGGAKMVFDFKNGYAVADQDYAWASPTNTPCDDVTSRVVFDWTSYVSSSVSQYLCLELWGEHELYGGDKYLIWSHRPGGGVRSGHADLSGFYSHNYIEFRVGYQTVPEPSSCCALFALFVGTAAAFYRRRK